MVVPSALETDGRDIISHRQSALDGERGISVGDKSLAVSPRHHALQMRVGPFACGTEGRQQEDDRPFFFILRDAREARGSMWTRNLPPLLPPSLFFYLLDPPFSFQLPCGFPSTFLVPLEEEAAPGSSLSRPHFYIAGPSSLFCSGRCQSRSPS